MGYIAALLLLPPTLVFGVYHLAIWFNLAGINGRVFWRRVAMSSASSHVVFALGFFLLAYFDYRATRDLVASAPPFDVFLFNGTEFWRVMLLFDTAPTISILGLFGLLSRFGIGSVPIIPMTVTVVLVIGSLQWYWIGGAIGAGFEKLWSGLKTGDDDELPPWL